MEHTTYLEKISLWLDEELNSAEVAGLQTHLADCSVCSEALQSMQRADNLLRRAARVTVEPEPGFTTRFGHRLAQAKSRQPWRVWVGAGVLLLSTLLFVTVGAIVGGTALLGVWTTLLDMQLVYTGLGRLGETIHQIRVLVNLGSVLFKVLLILLNQPLFWLSIPIAGGIGWVWARLMKAPFGQMPTMIKTLI